ncbi:unnamed protein product [Brachionus calyciflorus]|uniref:AP complex subunit sigma n=1 Tax=Brachionus calyciflorus TaxID=104777 RepID=A0A813S7Z5_9BILA|nr:unnamed protein product [Brachionus calyciflorus]
MISLLLLFNTQTKIRLQKWYISYSEREKKKMIREIMTSILAKRLPSCNFVEHNDKKVVYQRYANLFFCIVIDRNDNELLALEIIQRYVEILDQYFKNVCELDIIFNFEKAHFVWDELVVGGEVQESSRSEVVRAVLDQDDLQNFEIENFS